MTFLLWTSRPDVHIRSPGLFLCLLIYLFIKEEKIASAICNQGYLINSLKVGNGVHSLSPAEIKEYYAR